MSTEQNPKKHINVGMVGTGNYKRQALLAAQLASATLGLPIIGSRTPTFDIAAPQSQKHGPEWYQRLGEKYAEEMKEKARLKMERKKKRLK